MKEHKLNSKVEVYKEGNPDSKVSHDVILVEPSADSKLNKDLVLRVDGTRGQWYLSTLLGLSNSSYDNDHPCQIPDYIYIDYGNRIVASGLREAILEALTKCAARFYMRET